MNVLNLDYPKNWLEAQVFIKNIKLEFIKIDTLSNSKLKTGKIMQLNKIIYAILKTLEEEIKTSSEYGKTKNLMIARAVILDLIKDRKLLERG